MFGMFRRSHILFTAAAFTVMLAAISVFSFAVSDLSTFVYAESAVSETPGATYTPKYVASKHRAKVTVKWSKAYARLEDGTITDVSGYEVQYSTRSNFSKAKTLYRGSASKSTVITLKKLNTKKRYRRKIKKYHFRVRSYVTVDGKKTYSSWSNAEKVRDLTVYAKTQVTALSAKKNTVTVSWKKVTCSKGYVIFAKKNGTNIWKKRKHVYGASKVKCTDKGLSYSCGYSYCVIPYSKRKTKTPAKYNGSYLNIQRKSGISRSVVTEKYQMSAPSCRAAFSNGALKVMWAVVPYAKSYRIEVSRTSDFIEPVVIDVTDSDIIESGNSYTKVISEITADSDCYVRMKAFGKYNKEACESGYSKSVFVDHNAGTYIIQFSGNSSTSGSMSSCSVQSGEEFQLPPNKYKRKGYRFAGWCFKENNELFLDSVLPMQFGMPDYFDGDIVQDLTGPGCKIKLYACWEAYGPEAAADWATTIAADDDFYYGTVVKNHCWFCQGGKKTYICNALVAASYTHGMRYFTSYRAGSTEYKWWLKNGFSSVGKKVSMSKIKKGDIICCWNGRRWSHIMIAITDGTDANPRIAHAAGRGTGAKSIREDDMKGRLKRYKSYYVVRLKEWKPYTVSTNGLN